VFQLVSVLSRHYASAVRLSPVLASRLARRLRAPDPVFVKQDEYVIDVKKARLRHPLLPNDLSRFDLDGGQEGGAVVAA
jgi:hypothetical protein